MQRRSLKAEQLPFLVLIVGLQGVTTGLGWAMAAPSLAQPSAQWLPESSALDVIEGNRPLAAWSRDGQRCFEYPKYTVIEKTGVSLDALLISVMPATVRCRQFDQQRGIKPVFEVHNDAELFAGLVGNILVTDTGSGPDGRVLSLYDVVSRSKLRQFPDFYGPVQLKDKTKLFFWLTSARATPQNCSGYGQRALQQLGSAIETQVFMDLVHHKLHKTNNVRCNARQVPLR